MGYKMLFVKCIQCRGIYKNNVVSKNIQLEINENEKNKKTNATTMFIRQVMLYIIFTVCFLIKVSVRHVHSFRTDKFFEV